MRVLMLSWEYPPHLEGGMGQHVKDLVPALLAADPSLDLHVVTPALGSAVGNEDLERLHVHRVAVHPPSDDDLYDDVVAANEAFRLAAEQILGMGLHFDLVHVHDWLSSFAGLALQERFGVPVVATIHATERGRYRGALYDPLSRCIDEAEARLAQQARLVITCSLAMQHEVHAFYGVPADRITVIPNGVDGSRLRGLHTHDLRDFRRRFARPDERIVFHVGRLVYEKGADLLVETAPQVLSQVPDAKFVIGGRGPLSASLRERIAAMHLDDKVLLTGFLSDEDRDRLYVVADVCVFPSRYEPFGIVALEAMAAGTPVVVSDVGGLGTVVQHEETGLTSFVENVDSLAWAIVRTLGDPGAAAARAQRASQHVQVALAWPVIAGMTLDVYAAVRSRKKKEQ